MLPSKIAVPPFYATEEYLREIVDEYLNYDYSFLFKTLSDVKVSKDEVEIVYKITCTYSPGVNKLGNIVTLKSTSEGEIFNKYGKSISGSSRYFR